ncbi:MAG: 50S ribosomal protein L18 [Candidatus Onthovivens sp.]|nr:50S ribosomal protein L18 [Candidatus Onthovivens sp.]
MIKKIDKNAVRIRKHARVRAKISGTATTPRLCVYRSNKNIEVQVIDDVKGVTLCSSSSEQLHIKNGNNIEGAKIVGKDIAEKCLALKIEKVVFDRAGYIYHGRVQALADAAREGGLKF